MQEKNSSSANTKLEEALAGHYSFDLQAIFREASQLTRASKWMITQMTILVMALSVLGVLAVMGWMGIEDPTQIPLNVQFGLNLAFTVLLAPLFAAIMLVGVQHSLGGKSQLTNLFSQFSKTLNLGLTALMVFVLVQLGLYFFLLPGLYLAIATTFALMLVAEKGLLPGQAIWLSIRVVSKYWLSFIKLYCIFVLKTVLVVLTFGIALIWVAPFYYHVKGILYRDLFGIENHVSQGQQGTENESVFHA